MPRATVSSDTVQKDLSTCVGGYVILRRMGYGDWLYRQEIAMKITMTNMGSEGGNGRLDVAQLAVTAFEFDKCIVEHNLEGDNDQLIALGTEEGLRQLDPKIGEEISSFIDALHKWDAEK